MITEAELTVLCRRLPEVEVGEAGYSVGGKGFAWFYQEKVPGQKGRIEHRDVLAVRTANCDEKEFLLAANPVAFFTDAHYNGFPAVLVRLAEIDTEELFQLLTDAWRTKAPRRLVKSYEQQTTR